MAALNLNKYVYVFSVSKTGKRKTSRFSVLADARDFAAYVVQRGGAARVYGRA